MSEPMRALAFITVWSLVSLLPFAANAKGKAKVESTERQAKKACAAGDFRKGVDILADLYIRTDDATYVYNQGRCYQQNHQWTSAVDRFREYLRKSKNLTPADTQEVEQHIAECRRFLDEETAKTAPPTQPPPPPVAPPPVAAPPPVIVVQAPPPPPAPSGRPGSGLRTTGIVVGSAGIAALATAVVLNLKANSLADKANQGYDPDAESSQKSYKTGAIIGYGIGGAALAVGTTLYLVGRSKGKAASQGVALVPIGGRSEVGLALSGEF